MTTRIEEILVRARDTLADPRKERWTDARLLRLLDEGYQLLADTSKALRAKAEIPLAVGISLYTLPPSSGMNTAAPDDVSSYTRAVSPLGYPMALHSHEEMDSLYGLFWESHVGPDPRVLVTDRQDQNKFRVYPTPDSSIIGPNTAQLSTLNFLYGVTVSGGLESTFDLMSSPFGVVTGISQVSSTSFTLYYVRVPKAISSVTDVLELSKTYDTGLKHYICGTALRDDKDVQNRALGVEELQMFEGFLTTASVESSKDFGVSPYEPTYVGGI